MVKSFFTIFFILSLGTSLIAYGEMVQDLNFIMDHNPINSSKVEKTSHFNLDHINEHKSALMGLIRAYQLFISSQDKKVCHFTPSCSQYGMLAIKKYGILRGLLMTSDRLQRCHGMARKYCRLHPETDKCYDPVE